MKPELPHLAGAETRAVDPHSFFADPDTAVFLNADSYSATQKLRIRIQSKFVTNYLMKS